MKQILCFGDSNTWGLIPKTNKRYEWGVRWTSLLNESLNDKKEGVYRVIEEGLCGRTTVFEPVKRWTKWCKDTANYIGNPQSS